MHHKHLCEFEQQLMATECDKEKRYVVRFQGNNSKKWDGKETWIDASVLDELYDEAELVHGAEITVPWKSKGKITHWKGIFVDSEAQKSGTNIHGLPFSIKIHIAKECEPKNKNDESEAQNEKPKPSKKGENVSNFRIYHIRWITFSCTFLQLITNQKLMS